MEAYLLYKAYFLLVILTSLKILAVHAAMKEGMILFFLRQWIDRALWAIGGCSNKRMKIALWFRKPLYDCMFCMSSVWGLIFTYYEFAFSCTYFFFLVTVAGVCYMLESVFFGEEVCEMVDRDVKLKYTRRPFIDFLSKGVPAKDSIPENEVCSIEGCMHLSGYYCGSLDCPNKPQA